MLSDLKILLVIILCIPVVYIGVRFCSVLVDNAIAGRKQKTKKDSK
ncbi:MAG: hypothetical protein FWF33_03575 [Clostridiales bacterium]|nr:hypothetical protein [Clostridiales bacterium]